MKFHHLEICAKNGPKIVQFFTQKLDFQLTANRQLEKISDQWIVSNGATPIIITENKCQKTRRSREADSVFDVALQVDSVDKLTNQMQSAGVKVLVEPTSSSDENGIVVQSTIQTGFGNIAHTLLEKKSYKGSSNFLPGFKLQENDNQSKMLSSLTGYVDHITYACNPGEMDDILSWYQRWFGMERLIMNDMDDVRNGLVIGGTIGIRLKAAKSTRTNNPFFLVIAEPLTINEGNHVNIFLEKHGGTGVEHVALNSQDIVHTVTELRNRGLQFRDAPTYGTLMDEPKTDEKLTSLGILLDREEGDKHLYQAFTLPIFDEPTMFLEIIQRRGAQSFGAGNITRIMKSIENSEVSSSQP